MTGGTSQSVIAGLPRAATTRRCSQARAAAHPARHLHGRAAASRCAYGARNHEPRSPARNANLWQRPLSGGWRQYSPPRARLRELYHSSARSPAAAWHVSGPDVASCSVSRLLGIGLSLARSGSAVAAAAPSVAKLNEEIRSAGPKQTIAALARSGQWDAVVDRIGGGSTAWVSLAARLAPGGDAGSAEDIGIGLATALPKNPGAVLSVIGTGSQASLSVQRVCGVPFIEMPGPEVAAYRRRAAGALRANSSSALRQRRDDCLAALKA